MRTGEMKATRDGFGAGLQDLASRDERVVALDCDLGRSTRSSATADADPRRFIDMGISEQDMISTAAGLASMGKIPFVNSFAVFATGRCFDQIRQQVALPDANVKICGSSAGLTQGCDGATHQAVLDVALMRVLPRMTVIVPADPRQAMQAVHAAHLHRGPVYLRLSRYETGDFLPPGLPFEIGKAQILQEGRDLAIVGCGPVLRNVMRASEILRQRGVKAEIINMHTIKPLDREGVRAICLRFKHVLSVEEHSIYGGLGTALVEAAAELAGPPWQGRIRRHGLRDTFGESADADTLLRAFGLDPEGITREAVALLADDAGGGAR